MKRQEKDDIREASDGKHRNKYVAELKRTIRNVEKRQLFNQF